MFKNTFLIIGLFILSALLYWVYQQLKIPPDVITQSDQAETLAWVALITSVVSLLTALVGLIQKLIELQEKKNK